MAESTANAIKNIAIIGAGPSGLATAKYLLAENAFTKIVIYEQRDTIGGVWNYTPLPPRQHLSINGNSSQPPTKKAIDVVTANLPQLNTPMYEGLETNLPHMLMQFSDTPFPHGTQLFPSRETVMQYLHAYAENVLPMIRFEQQVIDVRPTSGDQWHGWEVTAKGKADGKITVERFDAVVVSNGHCDWPLLPEIEALDDWAQRYPESLHHSVSYKNPKAFENKRVLLVGGGPSAADIDQQTAKVCQHPLLVARIQKSPYHTDEPYAQEHPLLIALIPEERAARFDDGSIERDIDAIILCTGYVYSFPFLTSIAPTLPDEGIGALPLYQLIFHMQYPTLAFVETPEMIVPFPLAESQAAVIARVWSGRLTLPSLQDMRDWREGVVRERGAGRGFHALEPPLDLEYMKEMYDWSLQAGKGSMCGGKDKGKMPRLWDEKACWMRMEAAEMRKAFTARGEEGSRVMGYEELGFRFEEKGKGR